MTRLVVSNHKDKWKICVHCSHRINPTIGVCDQAELHLPCTYYGCVPMVKPVVDTK